MGQEKIVIYSTLLIPILLMLIFHIMIILQITYQALYQIETIRVLVILQLIQ